MKHRKESAGRILDRTLGLFSNPSPDLMETARKHALQRIESESRPALHFFPRKEPMPPARDRSVSKLRPAIVAVAAAMAIAVAVPAVMLRNFVWLRSTAAVLETPQGSKKIAYGEVVRVNGGTGSVLALADGSRVEMRSQSELSLERAADGLRIRLIGGSVIVNAAKQRTGRLYVQTKDVTVSVAGTVFLVEAADDGSRVAVIEGEVHVQQGAVSKKLLPGEQVATISEIKPLPVVEEIAWSRNAAELLSLLQKSIVVPQPVATSLLEFAVVHIHPSVAAPPVVGENEAREGGAPPSDPSDPNAVMNAVNRHLSRRVPGPLEPILSLVPAEGLEAQKGGVQ
jgi:hypothetical protein